MKIFPVLLVLALSSTAALGEMYTWKDAKGTVFYTNSLHEIPARYLKRARVLDVATGKKGGPATAAQPGVPAGPALSTAQAPPPPSQAPLAQAPQPAPQAAASAPAPLPDPTIDSPSRDALRRAGVTADRPQRGFLREQRRAQRRSSSATEEE